MITYLYWVHYPEHTDPFTQGYVGISNNVTARFTYHKSKKCSDNPILYRAILKGAKLSILSCFVSRSTALLAENNYRPDRCIGWNITPGGGAPPSQLGKSNPNTRISNMTRVCSSDTRQKMSEARKDLKWYTDGINDKRSRTCPIGFYPGRTKQPPPPPSRKGKRKLAIKDSL